MPPPFAGDGCELRATDARLTRVGREQLGDGAAAVVGLPAVPAASSFGFDADYVEPRLTAAVVLQQPIKRTEQHREPIEAPDAKSYAVGQLNTSFQMTKRKGAAREGRRFQSLL